MYSSLFWCIGLPLNAQVQDFPPAIEEVSESSRINWTTMRVEAVGRAKSGGISQDYATPEIQAMKLANSSLQNALFSINIDSKTDYHTLLNRNDELTHYLESTAKHYEISDTVYNSDQSVETTAFISLHTLLRAYTIEQASVSERIQPNKRGGPTGIIIDARSIDFDPVLFPTVQTNTDKNFLSVSGFSKHSAQSTLPFIYATDAINPIVTSRVGSNPTLFLADKAIHDTLTVHSIDNRPLSADERKSIMANGNVVILISE